jgi:hypothetical protein
MATIKLQNGKVITKDGKVSCECCSEINCEFGYVPFFQNGTNFNYNTFEITEEEYNFYTKNRAGEYEVSININNIDKISDIEIYGAGEEFTYQINETITVENTSRDRCHKFIEAFIPFVGRYRLKNDDEYIDENVNAEFSLALAFMFSNENGYKAHYAFQFGHNYTYNLNKYTESSYFNEPITESDITGYPISLGMIVDGNILNVPKMYKGLRGDGGWWYEEPAYTNESSVNISISTITEQNEV